MTKVLIIENHADMREILVRVIELMGFTPITAENGKQGVEKAVAVTCFFTNETEMG
jgi:DNA-binding NtrC family response regulator